MSQIVHSQKRDSKYRDGCSSVYYHLFRTDIRENIMKNKYLTFFSISIALFSLHSSGQSDLNNGLLVLSPEEYTSYRLGEFELPEGVRFVQMSDGSSPSTIQIIEKGELPTKNNQSNVADSFEDYELEGIEAEAMAAMLFIKKSIYDINTLGIENSLKIYSKAYELSDNEILSYFDFIKNSNDEYTALLENKRRENCLSFDKDLKEVGSDLAVERFSLGEKGISSISIDHFKGISDKIETSVAPAMLSEIRNAIDSTKTGLRSYSVDSLAFVEGSGKDPVAYYAGVCLRIMSSSN